MTHRARPSTKGYRWVRVVDPDDRLAEAVGHTGETLSEFVSRAVKAYLWLRAARAADARILVEGPDGLLREVRYPSPVSVPARPHPRKGAA